MRYAFIHEQREQDGNARPVGALCQALRVGRNGYYDYARRLDTPGPRAQRRARLAAKAERVHADCRATYGSPRIHRQLRRDGEAVSEKTVAKAMQSLAIQGKSPRPRKPRTTDSAHGRPVAANMLGRDFTATTPNQKWVSDITYIDTDEGWLYLAVAIDLFSRKVVGWSTANHPRADLVCQATTRALRTRRPLPGMQGNPKGLIHPSDPRSQYASGDFQRLLEDHGITCSMSRKGNCWDNAVSERFFGTLKTELDEPLPTRAIAHRKLFEYIEVF